MQRLEVIYAVRPIYVSLGAKGLMNTHFSPKFVPYTVHSESRCALRLEYGRVG
jgi:hypothetical protein